MEYINLKTTELTIGSYMTAFRALLELCPRLECSANESNQRVILPTYWRLAFGVKPSNLIPHCSYIEARHESLFDWGRPQLIQPSWTSWVYKYFSVSWGISIPFSIFREELAMRRCIEEDENGDCIKWEDIPAQIKEWCSPQHLTLEVSNSSWGLSWGLKDWHIKYNEICSYFKEAPLDIQSQYQKAIVEASQEVAKWEKAMSEVSKIEIPRL